VDYKNKGLLDQTVVDYRVYDNAEENLGVANVTLPNLSFLTQQISGVGVAGNLEAVTPLLDAMTLTLQFQLFSKRALSLCGPDRHQITLRIAQQQENAVRSAVEPEGVKHVFVAIPKSLSGGSIAQATPTNPSGEYAVRYWKMTQGNETLIEIDPIGYKCYIFGKDYLEPVRKALGI